jgi:hypothetical protein
MQLGCEIIAWGGCFSAPAAIVITMTNSRSRFVSTFGQPARQRSQLGG